MLEGLNRCVQEQMNFVRRRLAVLHEWLKASRRDRRRRQVGVRFLRGPLLREKWQRARTAPTRLWARLRNWHSGEVHASPPDRGVLVIGIRRPWLAMKFDAARWQVQEIGGKVLTGVIVAVMTAWIVKTWIGPG